MIINISDVANLAKEMASVATSTNSDVTFIGANNVVSQQPAAYADGALCSRGTLPLTFLTNDIATTKSIRFKIGKDTCTLSNIYVESLTQKLRTSIKTILALEPALETLLNSIRDDISRYLYISL